MTKLEEDLKHIQNDTQKQLDNINDDENLNHILKTLKNVENKIDEGIEHLIHAKPMDSEDINKLFFTISDLNANTDVHPKHNEMSAKAVFDNIQKVPLGMEIIDWSDVTLKNFDSYVEEKMYTEEEKSDRDNSFFATLLGNFLNLLLNGKYTDNGDKEDIADNTDILVNGFKVYPYLRFNDDKDSDDDKIKLNYLHNVKNFFENMIITHIPNDLSYDDGDANEVKKVLGKLSENGFPNLKKYLK